MVIVDTSVWVDGLRGKNRASLTALLEEDGALVHPYVEAELRMGSLPGKRHEFLDSLAALPKAHAVDLEELFWFTEQRKLYGTGLSFVDAAILASAAAQQHQIWTAEKRLAEWAHKIGLKYLPG